MSEWPFSGVAAPLPMSDVNTDLIYPQGFLRRTDIAAMDQFLFHGLRFDRDGAPNPTFVLNRKPWTAASILVAGRNFGSGSSREHAVWALKAYGIRAVVSPLFADIFRSNCLNNAVAPLAVAEADLSRLLEAAGDPETCRFTVDLDSGVISNDALGEVPFALSAADRDRIIHNRDSVDETMRHEALIAEREAHLQAQSPWLAL